MRAGRTVSTGGSEPLSGGRLALSMAPLVVVVPVSLSLCGSPLADEIGALTARSNRQPRGTTARTCQAHTAVRHIITGSRNPAQSGPLR